PRRSTRTTPFGSTAMSDGSRTVNVGAGDDGLPNTSIAVAVRRVESTFTSKRGFTGVSVTALTGPAEPVALKTTDGSTSITDATTWFAPATVPSVHVAVACPLESVVTIDGVTEPPLPPVT